MAGRCYCLAVGSENDLIFFTFPRNHLQRLAIGAYTSNGAYSVNRSAKLKSREQRLAIGNCGGCVVHIYADSTDDKTKEFEAHHGQSVSFVGCSLNLPIPADIVLYRHIDQALGRGSGLDVHSNILLAQHGFVPSHMEPNS